MALEPLATAYDLSLRARTDVDSAWAEAILGDVSARVRAYCGRTFTATTETVRVRVCCGVATLPKGPVLEVVSVIVDGDELDEDAWTWTSGQDVSIPDALWATIEYRWGYDEVPADVVAVVCQVGARAYGAAPTESAVTSESLGSYSVSRGVVGGAGPLGLLPDERETLDRYRARRPASIRTSPWIS